MTADALRVALARPADSRRLWIAILARPNLVMRYLISTGGGRQVWYGNNPGTDGSTTVFPEPPSTMQAEFKQLPLVHALFFRCMRHRMVLEPLPMAGLGWAGVWRSLARRRDQELR